MQVDLLYIYFVLFVALMIWYMPCCNMRTGRLCMYHPTKDYDDLQYHSSNLFVVLGHSNRYSSACDLVV